jgi:dTDP-4-dehydrorhamnose reductase
MIYPNKNRVLILGGTGLLGAMVLDYFSSKKEMEVAVTYRSEPVFQYSDREISSFYFDASKDVESGLMEIFKIFKPNYIINCIGIIKPYCKDNDSKGIERAVKVNAFFPYLLAETAEKYSSDLKIIQIATDCVYDGFDGKYDENAIFSPADVYGRTKSLGEVVNPNFLNIRTSIIGPELKNHLSLMDWFLNSHEEVPLNGYEHHLWNGITTLQFSEFCYQLISGNLFEEYRIKTPIFHYVINEDVSKYELLIILKQVFNTNHQIKKINTPPPGIDRTLRTVLFDFGSLKMEEAIQSLRTYMLNSSVFINSVKTK